MLDCKKKLKCHESQCLPNTNLCLNFVLVFSYVIIFENTKLTFDLKNCICTKCSYESMLNASFHGRNSKSAHFAVAPTFMVPLLLYKFL